MYNYLHTSNDVKLNVVIADKMFIIRRTDICFMVKWQTENKSIEVDRVSKNKFLDVKIVQ